MPDETGTNRGKIIAVVLGVLLLGGIVGGAIVLLVTDGDDESASSSTSTSTGAATPTTAPPTAPTAADPPCTSSAILAAVQVTDSTVTSVDGFQCGNGWAGTSYSNPEFDSAALLQAQNGRWVAVDRAQYCDDPSIPADVHTFCTVS